jgi:hypothetical protein
MAKKLIGNGSTSYVFDASAKTVQIVGVDNLELSQILLINNATRETLIYNPFSSGRGYTSFSNDVLTLEFDTTSFADGDVLQIFYDNSNQAEVLISDLTVEIRNLVSILANPIWLTNSGGMSLSGATLPNVTTVGSVSGVTTVSTVSNLVNIDSTPARLAIVDPGGQNTYANAIRSQITT